MNYAIILARSKRKRIKKKNIKQFKGKPIIYWTIKNIINSKKFGRILVSTDDKNIAKIAIKYGAEVPFIRPKYLSNDYVGTKEVVNHAIKYIENTNEDINIVGCFYGTSVFAKPNLIIKGFNLLTNRIKFIFLAKKTDSQSYRSFILNKKNIIIKPSKKENRRTQDLKKKFQDLGQFYIGKYNTWKKEKTILTKKSKAIILKNWQATDIDELEDWKLAEKLY